MHGQRNTTWYIVDGVVRGEFPNKLQFDITDPPPDDALDDVDSPDWGRGREASGFLILLPRNHPKTFSYRYTYDLRYPDAASKSQQCDAQGNCTVVITPASTDPITLTEALTVPDGRSVVRKYECAELPCDTLATSGDPKVLELASIDNLPIGASLTDVVSTATTGFGYFEEGYMQGEADYDVKDINHWYREIHFCDPSGLPYPSFISLSGKAIIQCSLTEATGDTSIVELLSIGQRSMKLMFHYLDRDQSDNTYHQVRGYNMIEAIKGTTEQMVAYANCELDAQMTAYSEYNATNGTNFVPGDNGVVGDPSLVIPVRAAELADQCSLPFERRFIRDPSAEALTIKVGPYF